MEKRVKIGIILLISLIAGLFLYGYFYFRPGRSPLASAKASIPVNAGDLIGLSDKDEALFNHQYLYRILSVRGVVRKVKKNKSGITVLLGGGPALPEFVSCTLDTLYNSRQPEFKIGDSCTIQGNCAGCLKDVILLQCIIEK
jgi:hypothetical protein